MKNLIFYLFVLPSYFFIFIENLRDLNFVSLVVVVYLIVCSIMLMRYKSQSKFNTAVYVVNTLLMYPLLVNKFSLTFSIPFILVWCFVALLHIVTKFVNINREVLIFLLTISTLKCSLLDLYISVNSFRIENLLFVGILNYLWFTSSNSSKIFKRNSKKVRKSKED